MTESKLPCYMKNLTVDELPTHNGHSKIPNRSVFQSKTVLEITGILVLHTLKVLKLELLGY